MEEIKALTDLGNADRFIEQHKQDSRYSPEQKKWLHWNGIQWIIDETGEVFRKARMTVEMIDQEVKLVADVDLKKDITAHARKSQSWAKINAMIKLAQTDATIQVNSESLDADQYLFNCQNGTLDLKTGDLLPHAREHLITKSTSVTYDANAGCPLWLTVLKKIMGEDQSKIDYLQKTIGYALTGSTKEQCMFIFCGFGANGKSTFLEAIRKIMGNYAMHTAASTLLENNMAIRNDLARLRGARLVSAVEIGIGKKLDEALTKQLTGGDPITSRFLFKEYFEQTPTFKLFIAANYKPQIRGMDHGIWRRIHLVPFDVVIKDEEIDKKLSLKLEGELPGILAWAVRGCLDWQKQGLTMPKVIKSATLEYKNESDMLERFIEDCCIKGPNVKIPIKTMYKAYNEWCDDNVEDILSKKTFGHILKQKDYKQSKSNGTRNWLSITVKNDFLISKNLDK